MQWDHNQLKPMNIKLPGSVEDLMDIWAFRLFTDTQLVVSTNHQQCMPQQDHFATRMKQCCKTDNKGTFWNCPASINLKLRLWLNYVGIFKLTLLQDVKVREWGVRTRWWHEQGQRPACTPWSAAPRPRGWGRPAGARRRGRARRGGGSGASWRSWGGPAGCCRGGAGRRRATPTTSHPSTPQHPPGNRGSWVPRTGDIEVSTAVSLCLCLHLLFAMFSLGSSNLWDRHSCSTI